MKQHLLWIAIAMPFIAGTPALAQSTGGDLPADAVGILNSPRSARMPRSEERGGMAARSEAEAHSLLVYKSPARKGGVLYSRRIFRRNSSSFLNFSTRISKQARSRTH
jgi:hypothetical protein